MDINVNGYKCTWAADSSMQSGDVIAGVVVDVVGGAEVVTVKLDGQVADDVRAVFNERYPDIDSIVDALEERDSLDSVGGATKNIVRVVFALIALGAVVSYICAAYSYLV